jgi:hypothetical protein
MKSETFEASIQRGSNQLYVRSDKTVAIKNGAFVKLGTNDIFYRAESSEKINLKKKFTRNENVLTVKGDYNYKLSPHDKCKITFDEYEAVEISHIGESSSTFKIGQKIYVLGGTTSSSSGNLTGEYTIMEVAKITPNGEITQAKIIKPGLYITPPKNPTQVTDEDGKRIEMNIEFDGASTISILERDFEGVNGTAAETKLKTAYPLPAGVEKGELTVSKQVILLDKEYSHESFSNQLCQITFDYSPVSGIPLLPPNTIDPQTTYNEGIRIIDQKLLDLEKRITRIENMNY